MPTFDISCGKHSGKIKARTLGAAWRKLTRSKTTDFAPLARFREIGSEEPYRYVEPIYLDKVK